MTDSSQAMMQDASGDVSTLWTAFSKPLRKYLRARVRSEADAEDLIQEIFSRIHKKLPDVLEPAKIQGWVYRIARNAVIDYYRTRREHLPLEFEIESLDPTGRDDVDLTSTLQHFPHVLPAAYREPLIRHDFRGESMNDVAAALRLTVTATKSRVRRARLMLRELLDQCCRFEFDRRGHVISAVPRNVCPCDC